MNPGDPGDMPSNSRSDTIGQTHDMYPRRRGHMQREAILAATRELLKSRSFDEVSVTVITAQAGITRSGFYFYFDSKHAVLAAMLQELVNELDEMTDHFAARSADESPEEFVTRMVRTVASITAHNDPVLTACQVARHNDARIRAITDAVTDAVITAVHNIIAGEVAAGTAVPVSGDTVALVRILSAATQYIITDDATFVPSSGEKSQALRAVEQLWLQAFWALRDRSDHNSPPVRR